jgi:DNA-binding transcriptional MocR family regulator
MRTMEGEQRDFLYETLASDISAMIRSGTLAAGERVPSVRRLSSQRRVSISTVLQAYQSLENRGLIEARPQSGYYVRAPARILPEPATSAPPGAPQPVGVHALVCRVLEAGHAPGMLQLGAAIPRTAVVPLTKLSRIVAGIARRAPDSIATYGLPPGRIELRRQIALRARDFGVRVDPDEIIITNGCVEAVNLCLRAVAKPGDVVAIESPTYFGLLQVIESLGLKALEVPTHPRRGVSLEALALAIEREKVKACVLMPNVGNPLGSTMPEACKKRLVQMLAERGVPLIEDSVYSALHHEDRTPYAAKAYDRSGSVLLCSSFTKTLAPGLRVGWVAPGRYYEQVKMLKFVSSVGVSDVLQLAIASFLENGGYDRLLRSLRKAYARDVGLMREAIGRHFPVGTSVTRPTGGYVLWVELPAAVDSIELYARALREGISLAPGPMFSPAGRYRHCLRVNCGIEWTDEARHQICRVGELASALAEAGRPPTPAARARSTTGAPS